MYYFIYAILPTIEKKHATDFSSHGLSAMLNRNALPIRTANAEVEGEGFYAAIIVENRNPKLKEITEEFEQTAQMLIEEKPENS